MAGLADKRLVLVTGKGGVGKSTVAIALGIAAARRGLRTIVAELSGQARAAGTFGLDPPPPGHVEAGGEIALGGGLHAISIETERATEEYLHDRAGRLGDLLAGSRAFHAFAAATPGMRELIAIGKAWELAQERRRVAGTRPYDLVIVDAPATGHALGTLRAPRTFAAIAQVGPIASQGAAIDATLRDPHQTAVVAVALPEEMPVTETLMLVRRLRDELGIAPATVVANACLPARLGPRQARTVADALAGLGASASAALRAALATALAERARSVEQRAQLERLTAGIGRTPLELPYVFAAAPAAPGRAIGAGTSPAPALDVPALEPLVARLEELL